MKLVSIDKCQADWQIVVEFPRSWWARLMGRPAMVHTFRGDCTVWYFYPSGAVAPLDLRRKLYSFWLAEWRREEHA